MTKPTIPFHPLIDEKPADTLTHIQMMLRFVQESAAQTTTQATQDKTITIQQTRISNQLQGMISMINEALDYEIQRLENYGPLDGEK